jgi:proline dehydrogenase
MLAKIVASTLPYIPKRVVGRIAKRYVAGEQLTDALDAVRSMNERGAMGTIDLLGEEVKESSKAVAATEEYSRILEQLHLRGLQSNISVKLTSLGLKVDEGLCRENVERLAITAKSYGNFLRIDMEDHSCTDATLRLYKQLQEVHGNLGVVLQAYLRRTLGDVDTLPGCGANVRICKGIYSEPPSLAWTNHSTVQANYLHILEKLIRNGVYVGIATHDEHLVCQAIALIDRYKLSRDRYEFQMLLGVLPELRDIILALGYRLRVYIPYGTDWYAYSIRRLRENPRIAYHVLRAMGRT